MRKIQGVSIWLLPIMLAMLSCAHTPQAPEPPNTVSAAAPSPEQGLHLEGAPPPTDIGTVKQSEDIIIREPPVTESPRNTEQTQTTFTAPSDVQDRTAGVSKAQAPAAAEDISAENPPPEQELLASPEKEIPRPQAKGCNLTYQYNAKIDEYMKRNLTRNRAYFEYCLERFDKVRPTMERIFLEHGLPKDLVYLAMVESAGNPNAVSPAGAVGYWQFLPGTARLYGLRVDRWVDERRDLEKSTHAAAAYLTYLHGLFDDWLLACAAYNAGEGSIRRLLDRYDNVKSFWDISRPMLYKDETLAFVPKIFATIRIAKDREKYGVKHYDEGIPPYDVIKVATFTTFEQLADASGCPVTTLAGLNPELVRKCTPPHSGGYELKIPRGTGDVVARVLHDNNGQEDTRYAAHVVQKGDTLYAIARKHNTTTARIASFNNISASSKLSIGAKLMIPEDLYLKAIEKPSYAVAKAKRVEDTPTTSLFDDRDTLNQNKSSSKSKSQKTRQAKASSKPRIYLVRKGDTIWGISRRFDVDPKDLMRWNDTLGQIKPGEKLKIFARNAS